MRIAIHDYAGFSFIFDLSYELANRGHTVLHLYTDSSGGPNGMIEQHPCNGLHIKNISIDRVNKDHLLKKMATRKKLWQSCR